MLLQRDSAPGWGALGAETREGFPEQVALGLAFEPKVNFSLWKWCRAAGGHPAKDKLLKLSVRSSGVRARQPMWHLVVSAGCHLICRS